MLYENMMVECQMLVKEREPDGYGGSRVVWKDGMLFNAAIVFDNSMQAKRAEAEGVKSLYTVYTSKGIVLDFHEVFKRLSDGKVFRVTSDGGDNKSPEVTTIDLSIVSAEKWELTS